MCATSVLGKPRRSLSITDAIASSFVCPDGGHESKVISVKSQVSVAQSEAVDNNVSGILVTCQNVGGGMGVGG